MNSGTESDILLRKYLLGDVSLDQILQVEDQLATHPEYRDQLGAAEDELIDDFLHQDLSDDELVKFKRHFLTTDERIESLRIARALKRFTERNPAALPAPKPVGRGWRSRWPAFWWQAPVAATAGITLVVGGIAIFRVRRSPELTARQTNVRVDNPIPQISAPDPKGPATDSPPTILSTPTIGEKKTTPAARTRHPRRVPEPANAGNPIIMLYASLDTRSDDVSRNRVVPGSEKAVILQLPIDDETPGHKFIATITDQTNTGILSTPNLRSVRLSNGVVLVNLTVPVRLLTPQTFEITLNRQGSSGPAKIVRKFKFYVPSSAMK